MITQPNTILTPSASTQFWDRVVDVAEARTAEERLLEAAAQAKQPPIPYDEFIKGAWPIIEPVTELQWNWHVDAIIEHLVAVTEGEINRLLITIPPGHMKSVLLGQCWQPWVWTHSPSTRWLSTAHAQKVSRRDMGKAELIIKSEWYQSNWGHMFELTKDSIDWQENNKTGYRIQSTTASAVMGVKADYIFCDDPHDPKNVESTLIRQAVVSWWREVILGRLSSIVSGKLIVVGQRTHQEDLQQYCKEAGYVHLNLPAEYEGKKCVTVLGTFDPREKEDELLFPSRYPREAIDEMKVTLGTWGTAAQLQQRPTPRGGGLFKRPWFVLCDAVPLQGTRVRYWDKAGTEDGGKYTAGVLMCKAEGIYYVEHVIRGQWGAVNREKVIKQTADLDAQRYGRGIVKIWLEQEPGSGGKESAQGTVKNLAGHWVKYEPASGDKFTRAGPFAVQCEANNVRVVRADWTEDFITEMEGASPGSKYLDQMDAASGAFNKLSLGKDRPQGIKIVSMESKSHYVGAAEE